MNGKPRPRVAEAEVFKDGVLVTFADGHWALYPAQLLYDNLELAQTMSKLPDYPQLPLDE